MTIFTRARFARVHEQIQAEWDALDPDTRPGWLHFYAERLCEIDAADKAGKNHDS